MDYNYIISEINVSIGNLERLRREVEQMQREQQGQPEPQVGQQSFAPSPAPSQIRDPTAKSLADMVTPKQLGLIRSLAREAALDADEECQHVFKCRTEDLSKRAASSFIDHLKNCVSEFNQPRKAS